VAGVVVGGNAVGVGGAGGEAGIAVGGAAGADGGDGGGAAVAVDAVAGKAGAAGVGGGRPAEVHLVAARGRGAQVLRHRGGGRVGRRRRPGRLRGLGGLRILVAGVVVGGDAVGVGGAGGEA